jgi:hypothetical protein
MPQNQRIREPQKTDKSGKGALPTPPDVRVRIRRFNDDGQAMPRESSGSVTPVRLAPHPGSLQRSCLRLVLCQSEFSFGILISLRIPVSHRGLKPHKLMPMTGVHKAVNRSRGGPITFSQPIKPPRLRLPPALDWSMF